MNKSFETYQFQIIIISTPTRTLRFLNEIGDYLEETLENSEIFEFSAPSKRDLKRSLARQNRTTYIYDFPLLFARIFSEKTENETINWKSLVEIHEITLGENGEIQLISDPEILENRAASGLNTSSVVAWLLKIKTTSLEFVLIGNDITHQVGSFAMPEHGLFEAASKLARQRKIPRINISCNSGARIGLARDVLDVLKVKLKANGHDFDYLYVDATEKERIGSQIVYEQHGEELKLVAVKGKKNEYIGVENLMGSGAIGGETSRAYREIPTYCYVTGRSVGIGAYTARLARRIIQHEKSHLILTGAMALNTLLGKKVYASNNRLGGTEIMSNNGIAHATVASDLAAVRKLVEWLNFLPQKQPEYPFFKCFTSSDPSSDDVTTLEDVEVTRDEMQKDVRNVIGGVNGRQGIFDCGSFDEICPAWAASIVTGRATLNGLPVGVIASQWKSFEKRQLADESVENSVETQTMKAGQVWYPDSAFKTSQAISDFNRESLPLVMIASLRGFSGGRKDMSDQVLTFGAHIIDELSQYTQPVIVYIPAGGELRGGAWAVVDSNVNRGIIHVIADSSSRGGILEANAVIMERSGQPPSLACDSVKSAFKKAAVEFADMHDRWQRMEAVGAIRQVVTLRESRDVFWKMLRREMIRIELARRFQTSPVFPTPSLGEALEWLDAKIVEKEVRCLKMWYSDGFWREVGEEVMVSKARFEERIATWKKMSNPEM
uniref:Acetyl-CoA carboxylase n=1 Tax=Caenorhabditis japonica TaxID=281687 RepID=A0A8R1ELL1_CAEJA